MANFHVDNWGLPRIHREQIEVGMEKKKLRLVVPDTEIKRLPRLRDIRLNLNGRKPKRRNSYKRQLNLIRRMFR